MFKTEQEANAFFHTEIAKWEKVEGVGGEGGLKGFPGDYRC
jgi:hypothetical protein